MCDVVEGRKFAFQTMELPSALSYRGNMDQESKLDKNANVIKINSNIPDCFRSSTN